MYRTFIDELTKINPNFKVLGLTATPYRVGQGTIIGEGGLFTDISYDATGIDAFNKFIDDGYLCPLIPKPTNFKLDTDDVRVSGGEFVLKDLQKALDRDEITHAALLEAIELGADRKSWLVFTTGVEHAESTARMLNNMGVPSASVHGNLSAAQRADTLEAFKSGRLRALVNNNVLTTGFDHSLIDMLVILRPTKSAGLWVQICGRGTRPHYGDEFRDFFNREARLEAIARSQKQDCLVLDFAANTAKLGPINNPVIPKGKKSGSGSSGTPVMKECPECMTYVFAGVKNCNYCDYEFKFAVKLNTNASNKDLIQKSERQVVIFDVDQVQYRIHKKRGGADSLLVEYLCGIKRYKEFVTLNHTGSARVRAANWWLRRCGEPVPDTVQEAYDLRHRIAPPTRIKVVEKKPYPEVLSAFFNEVEVRQT